MSATKFRTILLFGLPGSGKGTQGKTLGLMPGYVHLACGDIFRDLHCERSLADEIEKFTSRGDLVPDDLTIRIWRRHIRRMESEGRLKRERDVLVLDGIPRTRHQAELLNDELDVVLVFKLQLDSDKEALSRIRLRALREGRLDDANESVIRHRLETFQQETSSTLEFYNSEIIVNIRASQRPMRVLDDITRHICQSVLEQ